MKSFSQRKGFQPVPAVAQVGAMNDELRNSLWNALDAIFWSTDGFIYARHGGCGEIEKFSRALWFGYFKRPVDSRPGLGHTNRGRQILDKIREYFFDCEWNEVYDLLEFVVRDHARDKPRLPDALNQVLARELAGYKFIDGLIVDITDEQESSLLAEVLADTRFSLVTAHLERALQLLADRKQPDYRNSIKESISAVEAIAQVVSQSPRATLGEALRVLEKKGHLHPALKEGFSKLYGYTSDADGIRHAMLDEPNVDQSDAKYFLLSCTSFINYLKANLA
jgi:AbiJ N-terminal domain 4